MRGVKLYGITRSPNVSRVIAVLNEKDIEYELVPIVLLVGAHKREPFLSINPFGQVPALEDGDLRLFESRAITRYLADKHKDQGPDLLKLSSLKESAVVGLWLEIEAHQYNPLISEIVREALFKPLFGGFSYQEYVEAISVELSKVLDIYEERLKQSKYLAGDEFTLADLHHLPYTHCLMLTRKAELITSRPHVLAWWEAISSRPAWKKTAEGMKFW